MNSDINSRIDAVIRALNIKKVSFAEQLKIDQSYVTQLTNGRRKPSDRLISDICEKFNVSETWLRTGEGEMFIQLDADAEFAQVCEEINLSDDNLIKQIIKTYWHMSEDEKAVIRKLIDGFTQN